MAETTPNELDLLLGRTRSAAAPLREVLRDLHRRLSASHDGQVADYIPELATADPDNFGISICTIEGQVVETGDSQKVFTIQSVSKPFVFGMALDSHGVEHVLSNVGVEPTGEAFNSIVLDESLNRPFNPIVNAGAIATADLIPGKDHPASVKHMLEHVFTVLRSNCARRQFCFYVGGSHRAPQSRHGSSDAQFWNGERALRRLPGTLLPAVLHSGECT